MEEGDLIQIDIPNRILRIVGIAGVEKSQEEIDKILAERKVAWKPKAPKYTKGALKLFTEKAVSLYERWLHGVMHTLFDIEGKKVIVTGGTRGLGKGVAEGFLEAGCDVVIVGTSDKVYRVAEDLSVTYGGHCFGVKGNLGDREDVYRIFKESVEKLEGDLDVLVTAHGIQRRHPSEEFPVSEWDEVLSVNLTSLFILCQEAGKSC